MEEKIVELASSQGLWTVLAVAFIFYILKNQEKRDLRQEERETKYQDIISNLTEKLNLVEDIRGDVYEIKSFVFNKDNSIKQYTYVLVKFKKINKISFYPFTY